MLQYHLNIEDEAIGRKHQKSLYKAIYTMPSPSMAGSGRRYAPEAWLAAKGTVGGGLSAVELHYFCKISRCMKESCRIRVVLPSSSISVIEFLLSLLTIQFFCMCILYIRS